MSYSISRVFDGRKVRRVLLATTACVALSMGAALAQSANLSMPEQPLAQSLKNVARQTGENILFTPEAVAGLEGHALSGRMTAQEAVNALLAGSGLEVVSDGNGGLIVRKPHPKNAQAASAEGAAGVIDTVVVTGTHIAGEGPVGSQVTTYTRMDLDQSGSATLEEFARQMPENLANTDGLTNMGSYANVAAHPGGGSSVSGAGFNLSGLGADATLTLVNGHRMAYGGDIGTFVDVSTIPFAAVDHIEVLDDGASSIYGSDAIAGVVNIIMRKDFDGAESSLRYGGTTDGGADEFTVSQIVGKAWSTGNALISYEYDEQAALNSAQRNYIPYQGGPNDLLPESQRTSLYFYGDQELDSETAVTGEAWYSHRNTNIVNTLAGGGEFSITTQPAQISSTGGTVTVDRKLWGDWDASLTGNYSEFDQDREDTQSVVVPGFTGSALLASQTTSNLWSIDALASGTVWTLPGGDIKTAIGGTYRSESFQMN